MAKVTGLSGNEIYCMALKDLAPGELVVGNSVNSMGFLGGMAAGLKGIAGGEISQITQAIEEGRLNAFERMVAEAKKEGAVGVTGVTGELKDFIGNTEFLFVGSCLHDMEPGRPGFRDGPLRTARRVDRLWPHHEVGQLPIRARPDLL